MIQVDTQCGVPDIRLDAVDDLADSMMRLTSLLRALHLGIELAKYEVRLPDLGRIADHAIEVLNVAGPRESSASGIADAARSFMVQLLTLDAT